MIIDPRLECSRCSADYSSELKIKPLCLTERGCPIQGLAENLEYTKYCYGFVKAKRFERLGYQQKKLEALEKADIVDDDLILEMESVWMDWELHKKVKDKAYSR